MLDTENMSATKCAHIVVQPDVIVEVLGVSELWSGRLAVVRYYPDGASSGTVLKLSRDEAQYEVRVNWYTGGVTIVP